jgi:hypothetical protein
VGGTGIPRNALGKLDPAGKGHRLEQLFNTFVKKEQPGFEIHNSFAIDAEAKVSGFNDSGMNRPDRYLVNAFPLHLLKWERLAIVLKSVWRHGVFKQRMVIGWPELVKRQASKIRMF